MDVLSEILRRISLSSTVYFKSEFSAPWGMEVQQGTNAQFHLIISGDCLVRTQKLKIRLRKGDMVIFPDGINHWLADSESSPRVKGQEVVKSINNGVPIFSGDKVSATLLCGHFEFNRDFDHPFISEMPEIIHLTPTGNNELQWLEHVAQLIEIEIGSGEEGSNVVVDKLGEVLFIYAIRAYVNKQKLTEGFIAALHDQRISKSLTVLHSNPEKRWTLAELSKMAGMSRTSFCNQFKSLVGVTPLQYLTHWRILIAKQLLKETDKTVAEVALGVGYSSEAAFNRLFKSWVDQTPSKFRRQSGNAIDL